MERADPSDERSAPQARTMRLVGGLLIAAAVLAGLAVVVRLPSPPGSARSRPMPPWPPTPAPIDGKRAFGYLEKICEIGPRIAGSEANTKQRQMVADHFKAKGATVREQPSRRDRPADRRARSTMVNLIGSWHPERPQIGSSSAPITTPGRFPTRNTTPPAASSRSSAPTTAPRASPC